MWLPGTHGCAGLLLSVVSCRRDKYRFVGPKRGLQRQGCSVTFSNKPLIMLHKSV